MHLDIPHSTFEKANHHLLSVWPEEGCGFLVGRNALGDQFHPVENELHSERAYRMNPSEQIKIMIDSEEHQRDILAIIHSHPNGPAHPSRTDMLEAKWTDICYIIVSLKDQNKPIWKGWLINSEKYEEIPLFFQKSNKNG